MTVESFCQSLARCGVTPGSRVLAAVSGGADSVALLRLLCAAAEPMRLTVLCAHVEHGIRGESAREDEAFVRALCAWLGVPLTVGRVDAPSCARERGGGLEDAARALRYGFLDRAADELCAGYVALAHHRRDQAETVLLRAARGCDVRGLCAMRVRRGRYVRPLLGFSPEELREYLKETGQSWREDATNADVRYARNRVRLRALPELERAYPGAQEALCRLARAAQRDEDYFARQLSALPEPLWLANGLARELAPLRGMHDALLGRLIAQMAEACDLGAQSARTVEAVCSAIHGQESAAVNLTDGAHAHIGKRFLCVTRGVVPPDAPVASSGETQTPYGVFRVRPAMPGETGDGVRAQAIPLRLAAGLSVGAPRTGERMALFGGGHAGIAKLLSERGAERAMRAGAPVVRAADGEAIWLPGVRAGALCRVSPGEAAALVEYGGLRPAK